MEIRDFIYASGVLPIDRYKLLANSKDKSLKSFTVAIVTKIMPVVFCI